MVLISVSRIFVFLQLQKSKKTCHKVSVIHVTQPKVCPIQRVVTDIADQAVINLQLNKSFISITGGHLYLYRYLCHIALIRKLNHIVCFKNVIIRDTDFKESKTVLETALSV